MKQLELELNIRLLIVEYESIGQSLSALEIFKNGSNLNYPEKLELICKGSELTEGITKKLIHTEEVSDVEDYRHEKVFIDYNDDENAFTCGFESFISAIEAKGYYWGENPYNIYKLSTWHNVSEEWQEAESKTFNPEKSLIFEIL